MVTAQQRALVAAALLAGALGSVPVEAREVKSKAPRPDFVPGFSVGARTGLGVPLGYRTRVAGVPEPMGPGANYVGMIPIWFDAGYRLTKLLYVGGYFQYGFLAVAEEHGCPKPLTGCRAHDVRAGAAVHFHFMPDRAFDFWAGLGFGYEGSTLTIENGTESATRSNGGFEFANIQAGLDVHPVFGVDWGPFASVSINQYTTETQTLPSGTEETYALSDKTLHYFVVLGVRVQFDF